jgi:hypothetical protein
VPLHPDLANLIVEIEANASHAESLVQGLSAAQFNWRPQTHQWSVAECLSHLNVVNAADLEPLRQAVAKGRRARDENNEPYTYGLLTQKFIASMDVPVKKKFKAPKAYQPPAQSDPAPTLTEYRRICTELHHLCQKANGLDLKRTSTILPALPSPLRQILRMSLGARLTVLATHDRRHLYQAEQVRNHPQFPA